MTETATKDFFISYTGRDRSWAEWVAWTLEEAGYRVVIQAWDFRPGGNFVLDMQQATQATRTIAVLSALYLDKPFPQSEWAAAFAQDPTSRDRKLLPVRVEECVPPGLLAQIVYIDVFSCEEGEAKERLLSAIAAGRMKPTQRPRFPGKPPERVPFPGGTTQPFLFSSSSPDPLPSSPGVNSLSLSTYDESTWVGRDELISDLTQKLEAGYRILALTGITGIGKTALAEHLVVNVQGRGMSFHRLNFDDRGQGRDFLSGALSLLPKLGEVVTTADQQDTQNALQHLLTTLRSKPFLIQVDSLEMLLEGSEEGGWSAFKDGLWVDFFQQLLAGEVCQSQLLLTTQALPDDLVQVGSQYPRCWEVQWVGGLSEDEQLALFSKNGLQLEEKDITTLKRIGRLYDGHPLVLQVIAKDILSKPFNGNVQQYWQRYQSEFDEGERDRKEGNSLRALKLRVEHRVEASLKRLPADAYQMVCRAAVYRRPVPEGFWLKMVGELPEDRQWSALEVLKSHNLVEEELRGDGVLLLRQHNLVRDVARRLLRSEAGVWRAAEQTAAQVWLSDYEPEAGAPNIENVRGQLEAFHHHCEVEEWEAAKGILIDEGVGNQLYGWSYYREVLPLYEVLLGKLGAAVDVVCEKSIGNAYYRLSGCPKAIEHYQQSLETAREIGDRDGEGRALGGLGNAYWSLGNYSQAIACHEQRLTIARELGYRLGEGNALGNLGNAYYSLGNYPQSIAYYEQQLTIAREIGDRQGEGNALVNWGEALLKLEQYPEAQQHLQTSLDIFKVLGDRDGEAEALLRLAELYLQTEHSELALGHCTQALSLATELGVPLVKECKEFMDTLQSEGENA